MSDVDILGRVERRRVWTAEEKAALLAEIDAAGGKVRLVARRHRISESVLYNWRSARKAAAVAMGAPEDSVIEGPITRSPPIWRRRNSGHGTVGKPRIWKNEWDAAGQRMDLLQKSTTASTAPSEALRPLPAEGPG